MSTPPAGKRPSLADLADAGGIVCMRCGCRHFWTLATRRKARQINRTKACRNCGWRTVTIERIIHDPPRSE